MPEWQGSTRRDRLPADWSSIRKRIGKRDQWLCQWPLDRGRCLQPARDIDHRDRGDNHDESNLWALCPAHHGSKTGREGAEAMHANRRKIDKKFRRTEVHPGLL